MDDRKVTVKPADNFMLTAKKELIDNKKAIVLGIASCCRPYAFSWDC